MEEANVSYLDENGNTKVMIDHDKCISCGMCVSACKHDARRFDDDTKRFFADIAKGIPISIIAAPALKSNMRDYKKLFTLLKRLGVNHIYDASLGADICIWAHVRHLKENPAPIITQPCPVIVTYCKMYRHDLLSKLSPIHSPMACTAIYMKEYKGIKDRIAALSPCMAKSDEFEDIGIIKYNITFTKLQEYLTEKGIELPDEETIFDHDKSGLGSLFPMPGGFKENIQYFMGKELHVTRAEGIGIYRSLDTYAVTPDEFLPDVYDVLNCTEGCNVGTASLHERNLFEISKIMKKSGKIAREIYKKNHYETIYNSYDEQLDLERFKRKYRAIPTFTQDITEADINNAFKKLGKINYEQQHMDCFACGSKTCYDMARKIAMDINFPENCIFKAKEDARMEHEENLRNQAQHIEMEKKHEADERIRILFDSAPFAAHFWDEKVNMTDCNEEAAKMFNLSSKYEYMERYYDFMPEFQPDGTPSVNKVRQLVTGTFKTGFQRAELICLSPDGEEIPVEDTYVRVEYKGHTMVAGYSRDLREHQRMLRELKDSAAEAEKQRLEADAANKAKSEFLSHISHEIRTPMNAILGTAEFQLVKGLIPTDFKEAFNTIYSSGNLLLNIINDMLDLSKIEAGKLEIIPVQYDIPSIIYDTVQLNLLRYESLPIEFDLIIDKDTPLDLIGDELRIRQVLNNILSNAFKYTSTGRVELHVSAVIDKDEPVPSGPQARSWCMLILQISDTGHGMTEDELDKLFDEYSRFNKHQNRTIVGTGLGMHITKRFLDAMNGEILVESEKGIGSVFTVSIPQVRIGSEVCGTDVVEKLRSSNFRSTMKVHRAQVIHDYMPYGSVLVVDDVESNLYVARGMLQLYGLKIETVSSGFEAVDKIRDGNIYDIIFMDHMMPEMNGIETTKIIRDMGYTEPIVVLTANAVAGASANFMENGFDGYLSKPIDMRELNSLLNRMIRDKQPPEVIEEMRQKSAEQKEISSKLENKTGIGDELLKFIMRDIENSISVLDDLMPKIENGNEEDLVLYTTTVHGIKSVLRHLNVKELCAAAYKLEQAGDGGRRDEILKDTPALIEAIRSLLGGYRPKADETAYEASPGDMDLLEKKLREIKNACKQYKNKSANEILGGLKEKTWPKATTGLLNDISDHLQYGEFKKVIDAIENQLHVLR